MIILFDDLRFRLCYERNFFMIQDFVLFQKSNFVSYLIKQNIANTKQLILEITDCCNLDCHCYLCPSPSNYEIVIGRLNLCHIK